MTAPIRPEHEPDEQGPYRVEVESERTETVRSYGIVVDADGALNGQFFDDEDDANDLADTMNYAWLAGRDAARKEQADNLAALSAEYADAVRALAGLDDYFDQRADADAVGDPQRYVGNTEMHRLADIRRITSTPRARAVLEQGETT